MPNALNTNTIFKTLETNDKGVTINKLNIDRTADNRWNVSLQLITAKGRTADTAVTVDHIETAGAVVQQFIDTMVDKLYMEDVRMEIADVIISVRRTQSVPNFDLIAVTTKDLTANSLVPIGSVTHPTFVVEGSRGTYGWGVTIAINGKQVSFVGRFNPFNTNYILDIASEFKQYLKRYERNTAYQAA